MKTILITGINGFLGSHLAKVLAAQYTIVGLEYTLENLYRIADSNYKVYSAEGGVPDELFTEQAIDIIIHAATFYGRQNEPTNKIVHANLFIPFYLLDKAIQYNCRLFINTDTVLDRFVSNYSLTKKQFQEWTYMRHNEIKVINMQLEHFYGPGAGLANFITAMINKLKNNEQRIDLTLGEQQRDFVYIDDVINAYQTVLEKQEQINNSYNSYHVCTGQLIRIKDLMLMLKELTQSSSMLNFGAVPYRENETMHSETSNSALIKLGWTPKFTIKEGLQKTVN